MILHYEKGADSPVIIDSHFFSFFRRLTLLYSLPPSYLQFLSRSDYGQAEELLFIESISR